jgi:hypothetical protein
MCLTDENDNVIEHLELWRPARPDLWQQMRDKGRAFWQLVREQTPPPIDPERDTLWPRSDEERDTWAQAAQEYLDVKAQLDPLQEKLDVAQEKLTALLGDSNRLACPVGDREVTVTRFAKKGFVDYRALVADKIGQIQQDVLEQYRKPGATQVKIGSRATKVAAAKAQPDKAANAA